MTSNGIVTNAEEARVSFGKIKLPSQYPDLLEIQLKVLSGILSIGNNSGKSDE